GRDDLGATAADIDDESPLATLWPVAFDAEMNQARFLASGDDFDGRTRGFRCACKELALVPRVADRTGSDRAHSYYAKFAIKRGHPCEHAAGGAHCFLADRSAAEDALAEASDFTVVAEDS